MTDRQSLALVGVCYILAFPLYGGGQFLLQGGQPMAGLGLVLLNSVAVIAIGALLKPIIGQTSAGVAAAVFWARALEGAILGAGAIAYLLLAGAQTGEFLNEAAYHAAMIILGAAGIVFSLWLFNARRVPPFLAVFGVVAYASLATAMILERLGLYQYGMWFLAVAGIFEISFALWLIVRGFRPAAASPEAPAGQAASGRPA